ncbi:AAA family ATPase [Mycolicibacterium stellerae]|uniref:AAA family ATPase n=1 Tax=Mycolicibacterium stellerae TaxID=2358193 RepID=UPI000F0AFC58|nr:LuxR family transcriptional regulator [Mycolicibacterium stellerae]
MSARVVSRERQASAIAEFLTSVVAAPSALVIEGEPGIGKTTLWSETIQRAEADGFRVMAARPVAAESVLAYASLADMLSDVDSAVLTELPEPQRLALDRVLLRGDAEDVPADQRAVAAGFLSIVTILAETTRVLLAVDDLQWLDSSSRLVVAFAARRLTGPVGILATVRTGDNDSAGLWLQLPRPDSIRRITVPPMSVGALHAVLSDRLGRSFSRPTMLRIEAASRGNPFYALEIARMMDDREPNTGISLPDSLKELIRSKVRGGDSDVDDALLAVACLAAPTVGLVARALGSDLNVVAAQLESAESRGVIDIDGDQLRFSHPIFARGVYIDKPPERRRAMHRRLAGVVDEPELRARHMALGSTTGNPETLAALDSAAESARIRGAPAAAAELVGLAIELGGSTPQRLVHAAGDHFNAGESGRARALLEQAIAKLEPGVARAEAMSRLGYVRLLDDSFPEAADLLDGALAEAADDPAVLIPVLVTLSFALFNSGRLDASLRRAEEAVEKAEEIGRPELLSQALGMRAMVRLLHGHGVDELGLQRALQLEDHQANIPFALRPTVHNAIVRSCTGELDWAHEQMTSLRRRCIEHGQDGELMLVAFQGTLVEIWRGRFAEAALIAEDTMELAQQLGGDLPLSVALTCRALLAAYTGRVDEARAAVDDARAASQRCGSVRLGEWPTVALGFLEVSLGEYRSALTALAPLLGRVEMMPDVTEIITASFIPDAVEAMVALDRLEHAEQLVTALERNGSRLRRDWMLAVGGRGRAMLLAARGDIAGAFEAAEQAMSAHERMAMPFERARTQLVVGQLQRRQRMKGVSALSFQDALEAFEQVGTPLWADRARTELGRVIVGARRKVLTVSERRVAELATSGLTNRNIAAAMFISPKTVESNLARIYAKLGIHSRAELGRHVAELDIELGRHVGDLDI